MPQVTVGSEYFRDLGHKHMPVQLDSKIRAEGRVSRCYVCSLHTEPHHAFSMLLISGMLRPSTSPATGVVLLLYLSIFAMTPCCWIVSCRYSLPIDTLESPE